MVKALGVHNPKKQPGSLKLEKTVLFAKGNSENPLSNVELEAKFTTLTQDYFPDEKATILGQMVLSLESLEELSVLTDYL